MVNCLFALSFFTHFIFPCNPNHIHFPPSFSFFRLLLVLTVSFFSKLFLITFLLYFLRLSRLIFPNFLLFTHLSSYFIYIGSHSYFSVIDVPMFFAPHLFFDFCPLCLYFYSFPVHFFSLFLSNSSCLLFS